MLKIGKKYIFLNSWNFSTIRETGQALTDVVNECIGMAREKYGIHIYGVATDNASNMLCMGRNVDLWHIKCSSHSGNLLCKSAVDNNFAAQVNKLLKEFKNTALESQLLELGGNRMVLIAETRWCSHRDAFRRCLRNLPLMRQIADRDENQRFLSNESLNLLNDPGFEVTLIDNNLVLDPICELINVCQKADCSIAQSTEL